MATLANRPPVGQRLRYDKPGDYDEVHYVTPTRSATREADVVVPLLQSVITGATVAAPAGFLAALAVFGLALPWWFVPLVVVVFWSIVTAATWRRLLDDTLARLCNTETYTRPPSAAVDTSTAPARFDIVHHRPDNSIELYLRQYPMPEGADVLLRVANAVLHLGFPFTPGGLDAVLPDKRARALQAAFYDLGFLAPPSSKHDPSGPTLTPEGRQFLEQVLELENA